MFLCPQYRCEQVIAVRDLSDWTNVQPTKYLPTTDSSDTTNDCRAGRYGEYNSLYAIHRIGMGVGRWFADGVQIGNFLRLQYRSEEAILVRELGD